MSRVFDLYASERATVARPLKSPRICILFPTSTMALNPPPLKLYNCANFALNNIDEFAKGQGYVVLKNGGGSQDAFADGLPGVSGNISRAYGLALLARLY
jgi:hypothetical protein